MRSQAIATLLLVALIYPFFEGMVWNGTFGLHRRGDRRADVTRLRRGDFAASWLPAAVA